MTMKATEELPQIVFDWPEGPSPEEALSKEWLLTNGLGSYASGTVAFASTRRYHGTFIPSLPGDRGRTVLMARIKEQVTSADERFPLATEEYEDGSSDMRGLAHLRRFALRGLLPEWEYEVGDTRLRRRLVFVHAENTVFVSWELLEGPPVALELRPFPERRGHEQPLSDARFRPIVTIAEDDLELRCGEDAPPVRMRIYSEVPAPFVALPEESPRLLFRVEKSRGYEHLERQKSPGYYRCLLERDAPLFLGMTSDGWDRLDRDPREAFELEWERERGLLHRAPAAVREGTGARLVLAADQFVIQPSIRPEDQAWARATGQDARSVIAGYHWFTDWGRDTMISLEGLTLSTGRAHEAAAILRTFQHYVRDGLLPNLFPEGGREGLYHTADATMWFFHAVDRYLDVTGDETLLRDLFPTLQSIVEHHLKGTRFNIGVDPRDGLLSQGEEGYQLTWMDAKVDGWVVTPRRGKPVEINALWFNALRLMADWSKRIGQGDAGFFGGQAERTQRAFNEKFWNEREGCLYDVVDCLDGERKGGPDPAVRPNQVFAISPRYAALRRDRWESVLTKVEQTLLTPVGLRSLAPGSDDYQSHYDGDLRARDAAYHQGTVWGWLIGHYVEARLKLDGDKTRARALLQGLEHHLTHEAGIGSVSEIFDATEPFRARGCIAQAWSIAELLRMWLRTA